jgi:hypothetical protein
VSEVVHAACANCGTALQGPFCHACGQEVKPIDPPLALFVRESGKELLDVDGRIWRSLRRLIVSPGFLTREYVEGRRVPWLSPLRLYLLTSVFFFAVSAFVGGDDPVQVQMSGDAKQVEEALGKVGFESRAAFEAALTEGRAVREVWMPRLMFVFVPLFAAFVALVRRQSRRGFPAHVQFALHVHAAFFAVRGAAALTGLALPGGAVAVLRAVANLYAVAYLFQALRNVYGLSKRRAAGDLVLVALPYWLVLMVVVSSLVLGVVFSGTWAHWSSGPWYGQGPK